MSVIKIAGKSPTNTVKSVSVTADGDIKSIKTWGNDILALRDTTDTPEVSQDASFTVMNEYDISDCGAYSLRIYNTTNVPVIFCFYCDWAANNLQLRDADGTLIRKTVGANKVVVITPDDIPQMMWFKKIRVGFRLDAEYGTTITGYLKVWAITKR